MKNLALTVLIIITMSFYTSAQESPDKEIQIEAMKKLEFMTGKWSGSGWMMFGPEKSLFNQSEDISMRTGGTTLLIHGEGRSSKDNSVIHDAMAVVYYDTQKNEYVFNSHVSKGYHGNFKGEYKEGNFIWYIQSPMGAMKYSITLNDMGQWFEIGERQTKDGNWIQFFEMTLNKE